MVLRLGINEWPMPGRLVRKSTYEREYHELVRKDGIPFVPDAVWKDATFAAAILLAVIACAFFFGPFGPTGQPDPTVIQTAPKPDFAFLWIYAVLAFLPPGLETPFLLIAPIVLIGALLLLPLVAGEGEKHWSRRPAAVLMVALIAVTLGVFTRLGTYTPWSPVMDAWTSDPVLAEYLHGRTPLEREGALVLQDKQCRNCHWAVSAGLCQSPAVGTLQEAVCCNEEVTLTVYWAGPLFTQAERIWNRRCVTVLRQIGYSVVLPQEEAIQFIKPEGIDAGGIAELCYLQARECDVMIVVLDGADSDSGACLEAGIKIGHRRASSAPSTIIGVRTDFRGSEDGHLNTMFRLLDKVVHFPSVNEDPEALCMLIHETIRDLQK